MTKQTLESSQLAAIARLFSASVFRELASKGRSPLFARLLSESSLTEKSSPTESVGDLFERAYDLFKLKGYRHEYVYKAAIAHGQLMGRYSLNTAVMLTEFRAKNSKADVVILNGTSTVYEIKTERDNLGKLEEQLKSYRQVFANVNVIADEKHIDAIHRISSDDVGILVLKDNRWLSSIRKAIDNPSRTSPTAILDSLRADEAMRVLDHLEIDRPKESNTRRHSVLRNIFSGLDPTDTHDAMVAVLRYCRSHRAIRDFLKKVPRSLLASALSTKIRVNDQQRLLSALKTPLKDAQKWA